MLTGCSHLSTHPLILISWKHLQCVFIPWHCTVVSCGQPFHNLTLIFTCHTMFIPPTVVSSSDGDIHLRFVHWLGSEWLHCYLHLVARFLPLASVWRLLLSTTTASPIDVLIAYHICDYHCRSYRSSCPDVGCQTRSCCHNLLGAKNSAVYEWHTWLH